MISTRIKMRSELRDSFGDTTIIQERCINDLRTTSSRIFNFRLFTLQTALTHEKKSITANYWFKNRVCSFSVPHRNVAKVKREVYVSTTMCVMAIL